MDHISEVSPVPVQFETLMPSAYQYLNNTYVCKNEMAGNLCVLMNNKKDFTTIPGRELTISFDKIITLK